MLYALGLHHAHTPLAMRELFAYSADTRNAALHALHAVCHEVVILDTCNRSEIYAYDPSPDRADALMQALCAIHRIDRGMLVPHLHITTDRAAAAHLLAVASGIDSLVIGEAQILAQVLSALAFAEQQETCGPVLSALFRHALHAGKRARTETAIGRGALSLGSLAVAHAQAMPGALRGRAALVIGAGTMGALVARGLRDAGVGRLWIASRTRRHAHALAADLHAEALPLDDLDLVLPLADAIISATASPQVVLTRAMIESAMRRRDHPLCIVDLALPRDVEPSASSVPNVHLFDLDALRAGAAQTMARRQSEIAAVQAIVDAEADAFWRWLQSLSVAPAIAALHQRAEQIRQRELSEHRGQLQRLTAQEWRAVERITSSIVGQMLHGPTQRLKQHASAGDGAAFANMLRELFAPEAGHDA